MVRLRNLLQAVLPALMVLSVDGCTGVFTPATATPEPIALHFAHPLEEKGEAYERLAAQFRDSHPNITIDVQNIGDINYIAGQGSNIDVFEADQFQLVSLVERDAVLNLDPILQEDAHGIADDFYPHILEAFTWQGQIWAVPADIDSWVLYYNKDLFDQAGIRPPEAEWSWNDFLEKAALLTADLGDRSRFGANPAEAPEIIAFIYQHGGAIVDSIIDPQAPTFDSPATIEAVEWYSYLDLEYGVMTPPEVIKRYRRGGAFEVAVRQHVAVCRSSRHPERPHLALRVAL